MKHCFASKLAHRAGGFAACLLLLFTFAGCSASATRRIQPGELSEGAVTLDLPIVEQDSLYTCGLASISALCQYWSVEIPLEKRDRMAQLANREEGLSGRELREALDRLGMEAFLFRGSLDRTSTGLYRHVDQGRPPLVMIRPDSSGNHYCLVLGYDEARENLILLDPAKGQIVTPISDFDRIWARCQRFTLLACPREEASTVALASPSATQPPESRNP